MGLEDWERLWTCSSQLLISGVDMKLPSLQHSFDYVFAASEKLNGRYKATQELQAKAHTFLSDNGIDSEALAQNIEQMGDNIEYTPYTPVRHADVESFLERSNDDLITHIVDEQRRSAVWAYEERSKVVKMEKEEKSRVDRERDEKMKYTHFFDASIGEYITRLRKENEERDPRVPAYAEAMKRFNDCRVSGNEFDIIDVLRQLPLPESPQNRVMDSWHLVQSLTKLQSGMRLRDYQNSRQHESLTAVKIRQKLIASSLNWLEDQATRFMNDMLYQHALELELGGNPSISYRLSAFISLMFWHESGWSDSRLEIINGTPIWVFMYFLIRCGYYELALEVAQNNRDSMGGNAKFVTFFEEFMKSEDRRLGKDSETEIMRDYRELKYGHEDVDPYKLILYKIIGRCELYNREFPNVIRSSEDFIWLQLTMIREYTEPDGFLHELYCLQDVQKLVNEAGPESFDPTGKNPWMYFKLLLATLQFERAIYHLYKFEATRLEAVHFAIVFAKYGLLEVTVQDANNKDIRKYEELTADTLIQVVIIRDDGTASISFGALIQEYVEDYTTLHPEDALTYLYMLTLVSLQRGYDNDDTLPLCFAYIQKLVTTRKDYKTILGTTSSSHGRVPGYMDKHRQLVGIEDERRFIDAILTPVAKIFLDQDRTEDAVYIYELATNYNAAFDLLITQLGDALYAPMYTQPGQEPQEEARQSLFQFCKQVLQNYERQQYMMEPLEVSKRTTMRILMQLYECHELYKKQQYQQALQIISETGIIPFNNQYDEVQRMADQFEILDSSITKNIADIALITMEMLHATWQSMTEGNKNIPPVMTQSLLTLEERIRSVLVFVGMMRFHIPPSIAVKLNQAESSLIYFRLQTGNLLK